MLPAMILAAGLGTRLKPLTDILPKPLMPIGDAPMLAHVVQRLRAAGCSPIVANAYHRKDEIIAFCASADVLVSTEGALLGTAGGLLHAAGLLGDGDVLVHNGDVFVDVDLVSLVRAHEEHDADATLAVVHGAKGTGNVGIDDRGRVVRLRKETFGGGEASGGEFTGVHVMSSRVRASLPEQGCIIGDVYMPRLRDKHGELWVHAARSLIDIGTPAEYLRANLEWLAHHHGHRSFVGPSANVKPSVELDEAVIGAGAAIGGEGPFSRCVVWPGAIAVAPCKDTIFASHLVVSAPPKGA